MIKFLQPIKLALLVIICSSKLIAQDNQYEVLQLGARNAILSGTSVSKYQDGTAVYQNPATLTQATSNMISFNTAAMSSENIKFKNAVGKEYTLKSSATSFLPSLIGGDWKPRNRETDWVIGYAIYHRNRDKFRFTNRVEESKNVINDVESPGEEDYIAQYTIQSEYDETAGVIGIGKKLDEKWSVGASFNGIYRNQEYREVFTASVIPRLENNPTIDVVSSSSDISVYYNKAMAQLKFGVAYQDKGWNLGLTLMTPSIGVYGSGEIIADINLTNIKLQNDSTRKNYLASTRLEKLKSTYKYPLSIAFGITKQFPRVQYSICGTWYSAIDKYTILDPGDAVFIRPSTDDNVLVTKNFLQVWSVNRNVINVSASLDYTFRDNLHFLFGYALDQQFNKEMPNEPGFQLAKKTWDLHHFNAGVMLIRPKANWIIGVQTAFSKNDEYKIKRSLNNPSEDNLLQGGLSIGTAQSVLTGLIISYSFKFGNEN